jgi:hypothetical protein
MSTRMRKMSTHIEQVVAGHLSWRVREVEKSVFEGAGRNLCRAREKDSVNY